MSKRANRIANIHEGQLFGTWTALQLIGRGGNGEVWEVVNGIGEKAALKVLTKIKLIAYKRFKDEVTVIKSVMGVPGILPILESYIPDQLGLSVPWYIMPLGTPVEKWSTRVSALDRVRAIAQAANTMSILHSRGIAHRDIKPANLVIYNNVCHVVDFGLVIYPGKSVLTGAGEKIGPLWTMAPEVRRKHNEADPFGGDVYSLVKSLWVLLTSISDSFDGQYRSDSNLTITPFLSGVHTTPLESLLNSGTANNPSDRPSMAELSASLEAWQKECDDFGKSNPRQWEEMLKELFPFGYPDHAEWIDMGQIVSVLNLIGKTSNLNHLFYPSGGGNDLEEASVSSHEVGCIEFRALGWSLAKPSKLSFESFSLDAEWCYFRLDLETLEPSGVYKAYEGAFECLQSSEDVTEIDHKTYAPRSCWDENEYEGKELSESARPIVRWFGGSIVIFQKTSFYNLANGELDAYSGRHNKMSAQMFREHISELRNEVIDRGIDIRASRYGFREKGK